MKKNYLKLVGSLVIMMCVAAGIIFAAINSKACEKTVEYTKEFEKDTQGIPTLEGYLFGGYYVDDESDVDGKKPLTSIEGLAVGTYYAKFVPADVLGIKAQISANIVADDRGDKTVENKENNAIRFVTSIDSTEYKHIGFVIQKGPEATADTVETTKYVYPELYYIDPAEGVQSANAGEIFCKDVSAFFKTFTITQVPQTVFNTDITVTPYWDTLDGTRVYGKTSIKTVNIGRSWFYVDNAENAVTNSAAPLGTYSNPYSVLQTALDADGGKYAPKIILKSDYELSEGVTVTQSLTLASEENKSISRADSWTTDRMLTVNAAGITVTLENITIDGNHNGAGVMINNGNLLMKNGSTITRGQAKEGANVDVSSTNICTLTMQEGSVISEGIATGTGDNIRGGNILWRKGTLTIDGGIIRNGKATAAENTTSANTGCGGNIHSFGGGKIELIKGEISGGEAYSPVDIGKTGLGGNICSSGVVNVYGGTISGGKAEHNSTTGTEEVIGCGGNIYTSGALTVTGGTIKDGEAITNKTHYTRGIGGNICANGGSAGKQITITGGTIENGEATSRGGNIDAHNNVNLVLGTAPGEVANTAVISGGVSISGGNVFARGATQVAIYDGITIKDGSVTQFGGNIYYDSNQDFVMNGGAIEGGTAGKSGGSIYFSNKFNGTIAGGTISGGTATEAGGNIYNQGTLTVSGGNITGGTATTNGGNIYLYAEQTDVSKSTYATMTMENATISSGKAKLGGNIYIARGIFEAEGETYTSTPATMTMSSGTIENGWATGSNNDGGGNIYCVGLFTMNGGTIRGGKAGSSTFANGRGGNIYVYRGVNESPYDHAGKITISAGSILDGRATSNRGSNIMLDHAKMEIKPTGIIKITGGKQATIDENGVVTGVSAASNVERYNNQNNKILISGNLFEGSEIGFKINGFTASVAAAFATIDTTVTQDASTIASFFKSDSTSHEIKGSGSSLTFGKKTEEPAYTAANYMANSSLFVPA